MNSYHIPVLLREAIDGLHVTKGQQYIDATVGAGGHTFEILNRAGTVLGIDQDTDAIEHVKKVLQDKGIRIIREKKDQERNILILHYPSIYLVRGNFTDIDRIAQVCGFEEVSGILFDLGVSSHQLDTPERGFSFQKEGILDMRMDRNLSVTAGDLVNGLHKGELYELFSTLGEEKFARAVAYAIVRAREVKPIVTTNDLAEIVSRVYRGKHEGVHPATRVFQALRIAVNDERNALLTALPKALGLVKPRGRIVVISFHSLEDRIVKTQFKTWEAEGKGVVRTQKPIRATEDEVLANPRSRSAKLRVFEKV